MIPFRPVELADKATIEAYTRRSECRNCDMSFANIYCWRHFHQSAWAVVEDFLLIRFLLDGRQTVGYMQPIGEGDFSHLLPLLAEDAREQFNSPLRLYGLCREGRRCLNESGRRDFAYDDNRALSDYIYLADDLRTLAGRKYQPKRNHLNRFTSNYDFRYEALAPHHFADCLALDAAWRAARTNDTDSEAMRHEERALREAFAHWQELELRGGVIYINGELAAFTYGSQINYDTFDCHIEKADTRYEGIFTAINKLFADQLPAEFTYINREEDMGLEGLRRSKLSYYPTLLWPKTTALQLDAEQMAIRQLWQEVFGDEESFIDTFLVRHFRHENLLTVTDQEEIVSMLHLIPMQNETEARIAYIYGVATAPAHRNRGYASRLIGQAIERARAEGYDALALIPAGEEAHHYYQRLGFEGSYPTRFQLQDDFDFGTGTPEQDLAMLYPLNETFKVEQQLHLIK